MSNESTGSPVPILASVVSAMVELTDQDILLRLNSSEDSFVERKTVNDSRDWLKTAIAFANSAPIGYPAILFIGVRDGGTIEDMTNLDKLQKTFSEKMTDAYPPIYYLSRVLQRDRKQFLAVIIPGSERRPHFAGQSFVRDGCKTVVASGEQFSRLLAQRNSKAYEILKWRGKRVSLWWPGLGGSVNRATGSTGDAHIADCNQFYVTLETRRYQVDPAVKELIAYPLDAFEVAFDHTDNRLELRFKSKL